ncbi:MAG TPA: pyrroloquinoline quinone biosynthesis protein PqqE [Verrucomicrobiae bacterium]|jgi:pyrroloquinoline quinone biosynthesis protein E
MNYRPHMLLAELTYRCPLHCPYCSNPARYPGGEELSTAEWQRVFREAAELGVLHAGLSGGEPLQRPDLPELIAAASEAGLYTNLITSAAGLNESRLARLKDAGLDSIQISFQSSQAAAANRIAGAAMHDVKYNAARLARAAGFPLTVNVVLHRDNIGSLEEIIALAEELEAERLELANVQYYGWAFRNRAALLPTREQIAAAAAITARERKRLLGRMRILFVTPDYYSDRPKPCMDGWGTKYLTINPAGQALPCPTAGEIKELRFDSVRDHALGWIWRESAAFNHFRGTDWMPLPCRECEFREVDFGGCRCQAALLAGDAGRTDPACSLSPYRERLTEFVESAQTAEAPAFEYRRNPEPSNTR